MDAREAGDDARQSTRRVDRRAGETDFCGRGVLLCEINCGLSRDSLQYSSFHHYATNWVIELYRSAR